MCIRDRFGVGQYLSVGDYCFVKKPLDKYVSQRFQSPNFEEVFQVVECHGSGTEARAYTLCDLRGKRDNLGFVQPVTADRLTPVEMLPLAQLTEDSPTHIYINDRGTDRRAQVMSQAADGKVNIRYDDEEIETTVDFSKCKYRWL